MISDEHRDYPLLEFQFFGHTLERMHMKADLHTHTIYSDGSDTPEALLEKAVRKKLDYIALTDHDTTRWLSEEGIRMQQIASKTGIKLLRGLELSTRDEETGKVAHILGFWPGNDMFSIPCTQDFCRRTGEERTRGSLEQVRRLQEMGYKISADEVRRICRTDQIFKHDVLKTMVSKGYIPEVIGDFYYEHFRKGQDCYVKLRYNSSTEAVKAITADGGFAVLAHSGQQDNLILLERLKDAGLWGIELHHPLHDFAYEQLIQNKAEEYSLYMTGGSDYHGTYYKNRDLGQCVLSEEEITPLRKAGLLQ